VRIITYDLGLALSSRLAFPLPHGVGERWFAQRTGEGAMSENSRSRRKSGVTRRARFLRQGGNIAEARLWDELKDRKLGNYKFVRQHPIHPYYADFACRKAHLVVEVDGSQHAGSESDRVRDRFMSELGWSVLRFWNVDVIKELTPVCEAILAALDGRLSEPVDAFDIRFVPAVHHPRSDRS
jgi:very-short-patch-repair endonuclease